MEPILLTIAMMQLVAEIMRTLREIMQSGLVLRPNCM